MQRTVDIFSSFTIVGYLKVVLRVLVAVSIRFGPLLTSSSLRVARVAAAAAAVVMVVGVVVVIATVLCKCVYS